MTTPKPPKGRRWLNVGETIRKWDRYHFWPNLGRWRRTVCPGDHAWCSYTYSRAIPRKTNRK